MKQNISYQEIFTKISIVMGQSLDSLCIYMYRWEREVESMCNTFTNQLIYVDSLTYTECSLGIGLIFLENEC